MAIALDGSIRQLSRIGEQRAKKLEKLHIYTPRDLLYWFPRDYQDRRQVYEIAQAPVGQPCCVEGVVAERAVTQFVRRGMELTKTRVVDGRGQLFLTFFNQSYVRHALTPGESYVFYGAVEQTGSRRSMTNPVFEPVGRRHFTGRIVPVYPLTAGISNFTLSEAVRQALVGCAGELRDPLPEDLRREHDLVGLGYALQNIHFPKDDQALEAARRRLVFEELFVFSAGLALMRDRRAGQAAVPCQSCSLRPFWETLPFAPTAAQRRAADEAAADLCSGRPMNRLLQGDVGSGKTVVAAVCAWLMAKSGGQTALMVPTELLARQHSQTLTPLLEKSGLRVGLLTGSMKVKEKRDIYERLQLGMIDLVIGTHALLTEGVTFQRLGLVITDEQHRFGVDQRARLAEKGRDAAGLAPHVLVMSATPIPRTLALIVYGDLDVSVLDQLPPGRQQIDTFLVGEDKRERLYGFIRRQATQGHQVYIVCPSVSADAALERGKLTAAELKAAEDYAGTLQNQVFPDLKIGLVHGRQAPRTREQIMAQFAGGALDILVATTVVEVGVDVPNATLMVVENAERFGLSQLHQLRGRVGRGTAKSYCVLVSDSPGPEARQRMKALCATNDGFQIAEEDLRLRGPGDFFGARQHGLPRLRVADLMRDVEVLKEAQAAAGAWVAADPALEKEESAPLREQVRRLFAESGERLN